MQGAGKGPSQQRRGSSDKSLRPHMPGFVPSLVPAPWCVTVSVPLRASRVSLSFFLFWPCLVSVGAAAREQREIWSTVASGP